MRRSSAHELRSPAQKSHQSFNKSFTVREKDALGSNTGLVRFEVKSDVDYESPASPVSPTSPASSDDGGSPSDFVPTQPKLNTSIYTARRFSEQGSLIHVKLEGG